MATVSRFTRPNSINTSPNPNSPASTAGKFDTSPYGGKETPQNPLLSGFEYGTFPDEAVAEQNQTYFAYFDGIGGMGPEIIDHTAYFIKYVVDDVGNVVNPEPDLANRAQSNALWNLLDNFESGRGKKAFVKLIEPNPVEINIPVGECIGGVHEITHVGRLVNIAVTEIGTTNPEFIDTMSFGIQNPNDFTANLNLTYNYNAPTGQPYEVPWTQGRYIVYFGSGSENNPDYDHNEGQIIYFNESSSLLSSTGSWEINVTSEGSGKFKILSSSIDSNTKIRFNIQSYIAYYDNTGIYANSFAPTPPPYITPAGVSISPSPSSPQPTYVNFYEDVTAFAANFKVTFKVYKNGEVIAQSGLLAIPNVLNNPGYLNYISEWIEDWDEDDIFEVRIFCPKSFVSYSPNDPTPYNQAYGPFIASGPGIGGNRVTVEQQTPAGTPEYVEAFPGINCIYSSYFTASLNFYSRFSGSNIIYPNGSYSLLVLDPTASSVFERNILQDLSPDSAEMGYSPITIPFGSTQPGDYIRFGHNEDNVFRILDVGPFQNFLSGSYPEYTDLATFKVFPTLGKAATGFGQVPFNHFNIYRIVNDGTYVVLKVKKDVPGGPYSGLLQPQYISDQLVDNYNQIITDLTDREIIQ
jgi:hypothetical protein